MKTRIVIMVMVFACLMGLSVDNIHAQRRDHLTKEEIELVRDTQEVDLRMEIFIKAIERRMIVLTGTDSLTKDQKKAIEKDSEKWGELPSGTKSELYSDIAKILNESIDKFEDVYERAPDGEAVPWAFYILADYAEALVPRLKSFSESTTDRRERSLLETASEDCAQILEARENIARPVGKRKKQKKS